MLEVKVLPERSRPTLRPLAVHMGHMVSRLSSHGDKFLIVQRVPDIPEYFIQTMREDDGTYVLEHRAGGPDRQFGAAGLDAPTVTAAIVRWSLELDGWDSGIVWERLDLGPVAEVPPLELTDEDREALDDMVRTEIACGYRSREAISEYAADFLKRDGVSPVSLPQGRALVDGLWLERVAEQATWQGETDPERLTRAFSALEAVGITAREDFFCCRSCGNAAIGGENPDARGFVYFHSQCTASAARGGGLTLLYGGFDGGEETTAAIGHEVVAALTAVGLPTEWEGDPSRAVEVTPLDWRKRLIG